MLRLIFLCFGLVSSGVTAGYPDGSTGNTVGTGDSSSNSFGYGYSGSFGGGDAANIPVPIFDFQKFLTSYLEGISKYQQEFIRNLQAIASQAAQAGAAAGQGVGAGTGSAAGAGSAAGSNPSTILHGTSGGFGGSTSFNGGGSGFGGGYGGGFAGPSGAHSTPNAAGTSGSVPNLFSRFGDSGAAFASGSVGPDGIQQSAAVYPENPNSPNINTRFGGSGEPGGFHSVFTSSQSHTTNVNGKPQTVQQASTTINDNGKVTTYTAKNP